MDEREFDYDEIEKKIGYKFRTRTLLRQAFVRRSYTNESGGQNNEACEFYGDKILDFLAAKLLSARFGKVADGEFFSVYDEGTLTEIKKRLVEKKTLAERIDALGLHDYLIVGKGDLKTGAKNDPSVKEDLFEAILGAVAIDSGWDMTALESVFAHMHDFASYISDEKESRAVLVQEWHQKKYGSLPDYAFTPAGDGFSAALTLCECGPFIGFGASKSKARESAATAAYAYLSENGLL